jgi:septal ring factor EnvC (AmiA/AmiB activator)
MNNTNDLLSLMKEFYGALKSVDREIASVKSEIKVVHNSITRDREQSDKLSSLIMGSNDSLLSRVNAIEDDLKDLSKEMEDASTLLEDISDGIKRQAVLTKIVMTVGGIVLTLITSFGPVIWDKLSHKDTNTKEPTKEQPVQEK